MVDQSYIMVDGVMINMTISTPNTNFEIFPGQEDRVFVLALSEDLLNLIVASDSYIHSVSFNYWAIGDEKKENTFDYEYTSTESYNSYETTVFGIM